MNLTDRETNPYATPADAIEATLVEPEPERRCTYCGEPASPDRKLVESPDGTALICRACAGIVIDTIDGRPRATVWRIVSIGLRVAFVALLIGAWVFGEFFDSNLPGMYGFLVAALAALILLNAGMWLVGRGESRR